MGSKKRRIPFRILFALKSVDLASQKEVDARNELPPVIAFCFFVKFTAVIFPAAPPQRGLAVKSNAG